MAAVGDHAERRVQAARVLEAVPDRHLTVATAPQDEHGAGDAVEIAARIVGGEREAGSERVRVHRRPAQEPVHRALGERIGIRDLERPEDDSAEPS
jgi:hypothetical protein